jgi:hydroxyethylthiazole kinase-like uncharacterized protein yjeF
MNNFNPDELKKLYIPPEASHKGQNGKLMVIGGSTLFHAASLWALQIASRVVDMVFYSSVAENNQIVHELKKEFRNGIVVSRDSIEDYLREADAVLIGPGMMRSEVRERREVDTLSAITTIEDEGLQSYYLTKYLLSKYPDKKWIIDAGALQMLEPEWLLQLQGNVILTPHPVEFERVVSGIKDEEFKKELSGKNIEDQVRLFAEKFNCIVVLKKQEDIICSPKESVTILGGNAGMTKGGTGDVLAGLIASLACNNDLFLAATAGAYINKQAGEALYEKVGYYFNASDLAEEIPVVMKMLLV